MLKTNKIAFLGYSGHAYVCVEIAQLLPYKIMGYYDVKETTTNPYQLAFLGQESGFEQHD